MHLLTVNLFDPSRHKNLVATPEELVRQDLLEWLHTIKQVPLHLMDTEFSLSRYAVGERGRVDLIVHAFREGRKSHQPWLLAECKAAGKGKWQDLQVQVSRYIKRIQPRYLLLQLGPERRFYALQEVQKEINLISISDIPCYMEPL